MRPAWFTGASVLCPDTGWLGMALVTCPACVELAAPCVVP